MIGRTVFFGLIAVLPVTSVATLDPPTQEINPPSAVAKVPADLAAIRVLLQSLDPREQAWGAWIAARDLRADLAPELEAVVTAALPTDAHARDDGELVPLSITIDVALDALVQLHAKTPPTWTRTLLDARPAQALILLSFVGAEADAVLHELAMQQRDASWFVSENLLLSHRAPGIALTILTGFTPSGVLYVTRDGGMVAPAGYASSKSVASRSDNLPSGYPPVARYTTNIGGGVGSVLLADGPTPVYYSRTVASAGRMTAIVDGTLLGPNASTRTRYLAAVLATASTPQKPLALKDVESKTVTWRDQAALDAEVARFRQEILDHYHQMLEQFIAAGLLTPAEAATIKTPAIDLAVRDARGK